MKNCIRHLSQNEIPDLTELLRTLNLKNSFKGELTLHGKDPIIGSPHRLGYATASAVGLNSIISAIIWEQRTGKRTNISIYIRDALNHLHYSQFIQQSGYKVVIPVSKQPLNMMYKCKDGRSICLVVGPPYPHLVNKFLNFFDCGNNIASLQREIRKWNSFELEEKLNSLKLSACVVRTEKEWLSHPVGAYLNSVPVVEIEKVADGPKVNFSENPAGPLSGINILDFTHVLAGPLSTQLAAFHGANVLHVTSPYHRDTLGQLLPGNTGKKNAYLDLDEQKNRVKMLSLLKKSDVFCHSYSPGTPEKFNIGLNDVKDINPNGIVYVTISSYGDSGLWKDRCGFEMVGQACSGFCIDEAKGDADNPLYSPVLYLNDPLTGNFAFSGILAALRQRAIEGGSYHVKVSLARSAMWTKSLGLLSSDDYMDLPREDIHPPRLEAMDTPFGEIKRLSLPYKYDNLILPQVGPVLPLGASKPEF